LKGLTAHFEGINGKRRHANVSYLSDNVSFSWSPVLRTAEVAGFWPGARAKPSNVGAIIVNLILWISSWRHRLASKHSTHGPCSWPADFSIGTGCDFDGTASGSNEGDEEHEGYRIETPGRRGGSRRDQTGGYATPGIKPQNWSFLTAPTISIMAGDGCAPVLFLIVH
jgi:hypothetical protein